MIIKQDQHHNVICDQFIELINNAGTMLQSKGFRATKAYLEKEVNEAYFASVEREMLDKNARPAMPYFNKLGYVSMRSTANMASFLNQAYFDFADYKVHYAARTLKQKSSEKCNLNLFAELLAKI